MEIIKSDVAAKKVKFDNGICWEVDGVKYLYRWALIKTDSGELTDILNVSYTSNRHITTIRTRYTILR